jgi:hypothetical protein
MIYSSADIVRILESDPIIRLTATVEVVDSKYPISATSSGIFVYVTEYPSASEFQATWDIWIVDYGNEPLDVLTSQIQRLLPGVRMVSVDTIVHLTTTELRSLKTVLRPAPAEAPKAAPAPAFDANDALRALEERFQELKQEIDDHMLLVVPGRPGRDGKDGAAGRDGRDGRDGADLVATDAVLDDLRDVEADDATRGQVLTYDGESWVPRFVPQVVSSVGGGGGPDLADVTSEPMGHVDNSQSELSFDNTTRTFTIQPVVDGYVIWCKGRQYRISEPRSVTIPDISGFYYIYFDTTAQLQYRTSFFDWPNDCMTAYVFWNAEVQQAIYFADERHGIVLDWQTHEYLHRTRGAAYANGFALQDWTTTGDGSLDAHAQVSLANGTFFDEDLRVDIVHSNTPTPNTWQQDLQGPARIPVVYHFNSSWRITAPTDFPLKMGAVRPQYNALIGGSWTLVDASSNRYIYTFLVASNNLNYPVLAVMGQAQYQNLAGAQAIAFSDVNLEQFPSLEFRPLYKLIYQVDSYGNAVRARLRFVQDFRTVAVSSSGQSVITHHGQLTGLDEDDHLQYVHIANNRIISASHEITGTLTISNTTDTVDADTGALVVAGGVGIGEDISGSGSASNIYGFRMDGGSY